MELQELVSMPISLNVDIVIDGTKFYSSENLKKKFVMAFEKSSKGKHITPEIKRLVDDKIILPCYRSKNILGFLARKLKNDADKQILGFYHIYEKKVVVVIENSLSIFGTAANNELVSTTMHECMHLAAGKNLNKFTSIFINYLRAFYTNFFKDYLKIDNIDKSKIDTIIKYIQMMERKGPDNVNKLLSNFFKLIHKELSPISNLQEDDFSSRLTEMIVAMKLLVSYFPAFMNNARRFVMIFTSLNHAYEQAFGTRNTYTTPIQELFSLSEVACVFVEMRPTDSVVKKLFKLIS